MKKTILLLSFLTLMSCKNNTEKTNSTLDNNTKVATEEPIKKEPIKKECNQYSAESAVKSYLLKTGVIEYNGQAECKATKINDDCDYRVTATFYLENLVSGDGTKDYMVSFDGNEYFVR
jgi:Tfp pilus assembly protein PilP